MRLTYVVHSCPDGTTLERPIIEALYGVAGGPR